MSPEIRFRSILLIPTFEACQLERLRLFNLGSEASTCQMNTRLWASNIRINFLGQPSLILIQYLTLVPHIWAHSVRNGLRKATTHSQCGLVVLKRPLFYRDLAWQHSLPPRKEGETSAEHRCMPASDLTRQHSQLLKRGPGRPSSCGRF